MPVDRVLLGMVAGQARGTESIDRPLTDDSAASRLEAVLGERMGVSRSYVSRIIQTALSALRAEFS